MDRQEIREARKVRAKTLQIQRLKLWNKVRQEEHYALEAENVALRLKLQQKLQREEEAKKDALSDEVAQAVQEDSKPMGEGDAGE